MFRCRSENDVDVAHEDILENTEMKNVTVGAQFISAVLKV